MTDHLFEWIQSHQLLIKKGTFYRMVPTVRLMSAATGWVFGTQVVKYLFVPSFTELITLAAATFIFFTFMFSPSSIKGREKELERVKRLKKLE